MLENFSPQAVKLIEDAEIIANHNLVGTEHLLLAMFNKEETLCSFLLKEEGVQKEEIESVISNIYYSKDQTKNSNFSLKFNEIIKSADDYRKLFKTEYVYDEHIFYSILNDKNNNAYKVLIQIGINPDLLIQDVKDIFNIGDLKNKYDFLTDLTIQKEVHPYIFRNNQIEQLHIILNKKQKNNPMLIGAAGVGKTALVEGYAKKYPKKHIYRFELGVVMAGTKYRGELEEKIIEAMNFIKNEKAILFIDEIHNIVGAGSNEGTLDIANILKPYLARNDINCIGATTLDEYYQYIQKDKALARRFQNIFIDEPNERETINILNKIKNSYASYHNIKYTKSIINYIVRKSSIELPEKTNPDKSIDILDELGTRYKLTNEKNMFKIVNNIIASISGFKLFSLKKDLKYITYFKKINKNNYTTPLLFIEDDIDISVFIKELKQISTFKDEYYLEIDLDSYSDTSSLNNLIGSSKGYVGYEQGGILSEHLIKYPFSVVYFKNLNSSNFFVQNFIKNLKTKRYFKDNKGRNIYCHHVIFIVNEVLSFRKSIGFVN